MANRTDPAAKSIRETNSQKLVDKAMELETQPHKDILVELIKNQDYKAGTWIVTTLELLLQSLGRNLVRWTLESIGSLDLRKSALEDDFEEEEEKDEEDELNADLDAGAHERDFITVDEVPQGKEIGIENVTVTGTGIAIMTENADEGVTKRETETAIAWEMTRIMVVRGSEKGRGEGREMDRRDREHGRRRNHSRSRSRSRDRKDRDCDGEHHKRHARSSASPRRRGNGPEDGNARDEPKKKKEKKDDGSEHLAPEIAEAKKLRAALGLKPLRLM
ncbi:hypothetical protein ACSBR2_005433 [Camellia fascicularis]